MRLLVIEDDPDLNRQLATALVDAGYVVDRAFDGEEGHFLGESEPYDAVILDIGLPKMDGISVLEAWRRAGRAMPVLILTARDRWSDKVQGFDAGADDYVAKPFHLEEVLARIRALLRRSAGHAKSELNCGSVRLDTRTGAVSYCSNSPSGWACYMAPDERKAMDEEIGRLQADNEKLKAQLASANPGKTDEALPKSDRQDNPKAAQGEPQGERRIEIPLPSDADIRSRVLPTMPDAVRRYYERERPIELRPVEFDRYLGKKFPDGRFHVWIRTTAPLPPAAAIHQCALAYASDMMLLDAAMVPHGRTLFEKGFMAASLDHALWFHRAFRADEWMLFAQDSPNLSGARGFSRGLIFTREGTLIASVAQEGLVRERRSES